MRVCDTDFRKFYRAVAEPVGVKQGQCGMLLSARNLLNAQGNSELLILFLLVLKWRNEDSNYSKGRKA